jgi:hypothetical protein
MESVSESESESGSGRMIAADCFRAVKVFGNLISHLADSSCKTPEMPARVIQDELGRFRVWAGNMGALQDPDSTASLDFRLIDAPQIRQQVLRILRRLIQSIQKGKC